MSATVHAESCKHICKHACMLVCLLTTVRNLKFLPLRCRMTGVEWNGIGLAQWEVEVEVDVKVSAQFSKRKACDYCS